ncbi:hypothetical protein FACS189490_13130 [Clostridia bacterium]|nr:hypothetical protein FACS189490_13130 [Clostridia bacterium]
MINLQTANEHLNAWLDAELALSSAQSYTIGTRTLTRANLAQVREQIKYWEGKVVEAESAAKGRGRNRAYSVIPRDL